MSTQPQFSTLIFDLGDALTSSSETRTTNISPKTFKQMRRSSAWFDYETGDISESECYDRLSREFSVPTGEVNQAMVEARANLQSNAAFFSLIRELKPGRRIVAMSNVSSPDWEAMRSRSDIDWDIFDDVFTSAAVRSRKPSLGFFDHVIDKTEIDPSAAIFVDSQLDNVISARSMGMHGILCRGFADCERQLRNLCFDPLERGEAFLLNNAGNHHSVTSTGVELSENFAQLLIYEATGNRSLVDFVPSPRHFNFFKAGGQLVKADFPADIDTTAVGLTVCTHVPLATKHDVMDEILTYTNADGIVQSYFDRTRPRLDPVVCLNTLTFFHTYGRGDELSGSLDWCVKILKNRAYMDGTLYYVTPDAYLFFFSRLVSHSDAVLKRYGPLLALRLRERIGRDGDACALAMRILACKSVGEECEEDQRRLCELQDVDGGWPMSAIYRYPTLNITIGNRGLTTAWALSALRPSGKLLDDGEDSDGSSEGSWHI